MNISIFLKQINYDIYYVYIGNIQDRYNIYIAIHYHNDTIDYVRLEYFFEPIEANKKINLSTLPDNVETLILEYKEIIYKLQLIIDILNKNNQVVIKEGNITRYKTINDYMESLFPTMLFNTTTIPFSTIASNNDSCDLFIKDNYNNKLTDFIYKNIIIKNYKEKSKLFQTIIQGLEITYKNNYDVYIDNKNILKFTIKFPELTIKNKKKHEHKLYDLFVSFYIDINIDRILNKITGFRTKYSIREFKQGYCHSHLNGNILLSNLPIILDNPNRQIIQETLFCLGAGPFATLLHSTSRNFDIDKFVLFLHYLKGFLSWESLSGGPYKYISNIIKYTKLKNHNIGSIPIDDTLFTLLSLKNSLKFNKNKFEYKPNKNTIEQLTNYFKGFNGYTTEFLCGTNHDGDYYNINSHYNISDIDKRNAQEINNKKIKITEFQDKPVYLELIDEETNDNLEITLKKGFYEKITERINRIKTKKDYTNYIARRKSKINSFVNSIK